MLSQVSIIRQAIIMLISCKLMPMLGHVIKVHENYMICAC